MYSAEQGYGVLDYQIDGPETNCFGNYASRTDAQQIQYCLIIREKELLSNRHCKHGNPWPCPWIIVLKSSSRVPHDGIDYSYYLDAH